MIYAILYAHLNICQYPLINFSNLKGNPFKMAIMKYRFKFLFVLDSICYVMTYPWMAMLSLFCSCFWTTTEEGKNPSRKFVHYIVYAPILGLIEIVTFPLAVFGYFFWILICNGKYLIANICI